MICWAAWNNASERSHLSANKFGRLLSHLLWTAIEVQFIAWLQTKGSQVSSIIAHLINEINTRQWTHRQLSPSLAYFSNKPWKEIGNAWPRNSQCSAPFPFSLSSFSTFLFHRSTLKSKVNKLKWVLQCTVWSTLWSTFEAQAQARFGEEDYWSQDFDQEQNCAQKERIAELQNKVECHIWVKLLLRRAWRGVMEHASAPLRWSRLAMIIAVQIWRTRPVPSTRVRWAWLDRYFHCSPFPQNHPPGSTVVRLYSCQELRESSVLLQSRLHVRD